MGFDQKSYITQSKPDAGDGLVFCRLAAVELVKYIPLVSLYDADAIVRHSNLQQSVRALLIVNPDGHGLTRVFDGILQQVADDICQMHTVGPYLQIVPGHNLHLHILVRRNVLLADTFLHQ